jgi:hypothetical protein
VRRLEGQLLLPLLLLQLQQMLPEQTRSYQHLLLH